MFCTRCGSEIGELSDAELCFSCKIRELFESIGSDDALIEFFAKKAKESDESYKTWKKNSDARWEKKSKKMDEEDEIRMQYLFDRAKLGNYYSRAARHRRGEYPYEKGWRKYDENGNEIKKEKDNPF